MTGPTNFTAADRDKARYSDIKGDSMADLLAHAARKSGRSSAQIGIEFAKMSKSHAKLNMMEYVRWKLFDPDRYSEEERAAFISNDLHWPIAHQCCHHGWNSAAEDKVLAATILASGGVSVPQSIGVIDGSSRQFPGLAKVSTPEALRDLLLAHGGGEIFGKIVDGMVSFGAFSVVAADQNHVTCAGHEPMTYASFLTDFVGENAYLLQKKLENHADFARYCSALATVRMVNMIRDDGVYCPAAVIKLPQGDNIADAFWRDGNLACDVDVDTGRIRSVVLRNGPDMDFLDDHPQVSGLMGLQLPHWDALRDMNAKAASIYAPLRYQSTDIALTPDGPVVVELNYGGGFDLPQNASGRGMLTPDVRAFFEGCGYSFGPERPAKKGGLSFFKRG